MEFLKNYDFFANHFSIKITIFAYVINIFCNFAPDLENFL